MLLGLWGVAHVAMSEQDLEALGALDYGVAGDTSDYVRIAEQGLAKQNLDKEVALIMAHEGFRSDVYWDRPNPNDPSKPLDSKARLTVGFGNTSHGLNWGDTISEEQGVAFLLQDIRTHKDILFAELALDTAMLRKGVSNQDYVNKFGEGWQFDFNNGNEDYASLPEGSTKSFVEVLKSGESRTFTTANGKSKTVSGEGHVIIYGFDNRDELLNSGQQVYEQLDHNTQAVALSVTFNMGSAGGPDFVNLLTQAAKSGNSQPVADYLKNEMSTWEKDSTVYEGLRKRRLDEANVIETGASSEVASHSTTGTLKDFGVSNPFDGGSVPFMANTGQQQSLSTTAATFSGPPKGGDFGARSVGGFNVGRQMAQDAGLNDDDERNYLTQFLDNPVLEQYGGYGLFLDSNNLDFHIGLKRYGRGFMGGGTALGLPVDINDPDAFTTIHILDYIQQVGITDDPARVEQLFSFTNYFQTTTAFQREFDTRFERMSDPQKEEELLPARRMLEDLARQLGIAYTDEELDEKSLFLTRGNKVSDERFVKEFVMADKAQKETVGQYTELMSSERSIRANANNYYLNLNPDEITKLAEARFTGEKTDTEILEEFAQRAAALYPALAKPVLERGIMPSDYFSTHKTTIEDMLERPVDMFGEFKDVLQFSDENGNPMSLSDLETKIRKSSEWQGTKNAELEARELATLIAQEFGMVKY